MKKKTKQKQPAKMPKPVTHPMQPIVMVNGVARFKENKIVNWLFNTGKLDLNLAANMRFPAEDEMQIAQLLGYSVSGFGDLSYADRAVVQKADEIVEKLVKKEKRK